MHSDLFKPFGVMGLDNTNFGVFNVKHSML